MSTYTEVEISPETTTSPVFTSVSQATRPYGSSVRTASRTPSEIWSATLSGCPSVTDSEVNRYSFSPRFSVIWAQRLDGCRRSVAAWRDRRRDFAAGALVLVAHQQPHVGRERVVRVADGNPEPVEAADVPREGGVARILRQARLLADRHEVAEVEEADHGDLVGEVVGRILVEPALVQAAIALDQVAHARGVGRDRGEAVEHGVGEIDRGRDPQAVGLHARDILLFEDRSLQLVAARCGLGQRGLQRG